MSKSHRRRSSSLAESKSTSRHMSVGRRSMRSGELREGWRRQVKEGKSVGQVIFISSSGGLPRLDPRGRRALRWCVNSMRVKDMSGHFDPCKARWRRMWRKRWSRITTLVQRRMVPDEVSRSRHSSGSLPVYCLGLAVSARAAINGREGDMQRAFPAALQLVCEVGERSGGEKSDMSPYLGIVKKYFVPETTHAREERRGKRERVFRRTQEKYACEDLMRDEVYETSAVLCIVILLSV